MIKQHGQLVRPKMLNLSLSSGEGSKCNENIPDRILMNFVTSDERHSIHGQAQTFRLFMNSTSTIPAGKQQGSGLKKKHGFYEIVFSFLARDRHFICKA